LLALSVLGCGETNNDVSINQPLPTGSPVIPIARVEFYALGTNFRAAGINMYRVDSQTGQLNAVAGQPFAPGAHMSTAAYSPPGRYVYGSDTVTNQVSGFRLDGATGALLPLAGFPIASVANASVFADPDGDEMYVVGEDSIDGFRVNQATGALSRMNGFPLTVPGMINAQFGYFAPNGFFYVTDLDSNQIFTFSHDEATGALSLIGTTPTVSVGPLSLKADETGRFLYCNHGDGTLQGYNLGANGSLTRFTSTPVTYASAGQNVHQFTIKDRILYIGDNPGNLNAFSLGANGALSPVAGYPVGGAGGGIAMSFRNPLLPYVYTTRTQSNQINGFRVDSSGNRTAVPGTPFSAAGAPTDLVPIEVTF